MVNSNGHILNKEDASLSIYNRGFAYGDTVFETIKISHNKVFFLEDHYFRLMASMRILRMEIPMYFTLEFLETELLKLIAANNQSHVTVRAKLQVWRKEGGLFNPITNDVDFLISTKVLEIDFYVCNDSEYRVDLFKDYYIAPSLLSTLKSNNRLINVVGSIYAKENNLNNCLILNTNKSVVEALNANIFLVKGTTIKTVPLYDGCIKGVMRKQIIDIIKLMPEFSFEEVSISPFELQKADELFLTNTITGIQPITHYRKRVFNTEVSKNILAKLNVKVRLT
ncbi:MAG: aminotransferase class IV [Chlorobi bacterium]|nr:aminotransferase class IV [Chlorobiota bacterium]